MVAKHANALTTIIDKLQSLGTLDQSDRDALSSLVFTVSTAPANHDLVKQGAAVTDLQVLLDGYACRYKITAGGARQIVSFHIPGDILDAQQLLLGCADHFVQTITSATIGVVPLVEFRRILKLRPNVAEALWRDTLIDASIYREWVLNVGKRDVTYLKQIPHEPLAPSHALQHLTNAEPGQLCCVSPTNPTIAFLSTVDQRAKGAPFARALCFLVLKRSRSNRSV